MLRKESTFKVITFNLRKDSVFDRLNRWNYRKGMVADFIRQSGAAVVGVQELMPKMKRDIRETLQGYSLFGTGRSKHLFNEHSDILVRNDDVEVDFSKTIWLSKTPERLGSRAFLAFFPRICTICEVKFLDDGRKVRVFNAHFDHISGFARKIGVDIILRYMNELHQKEPMPVVLMGDFNVRPNNKVIQSLRQASRKYPQIHLIDAYAYSHQDDLNHNTYHGFKGKKKGKAHLDYIFVSDDLDIVKADVDYSQKNGRYLSDHFPMIATLRFKTS
jgi:endonuclease/exonuclease/phosphatase family metal-dependent hydrolase